MADHDCDNDADPNTGDNFRQSMPDFFFQFLFHNRLLVFLQVSAAQPIECLCFASRLQPHATASYITIMAKNNAIGNSNPPVP